MTNDNCSNPPKSPLRSQAEVTFSGMRQKSHSWLAPVFFFLFFFFFVLLPLLTPLPTPPPDTSGPPDSTNQGLL